METTIMTNRFRDQTGRRVTDTSMNGSKKIIIVALAAVSAAVLLSGVQVYLGSGIPSWVIWEGSVFCDSTGKYEIELNNKTVSVKYDMNDKSDMTVRNDTSVESAMNGKNDTSVESDTNVRNDTTVIWTSPAEVKVQKVLSCDIDNDKTDELVLLCWKQGRYGAHKPFWVEKDEDTWSQHLFVYEYNADQISPKWMSSYMGQDVADITSNGKEAPYMRLWFRAPDDQMTSWMWDSWGFKKEETKITFTAFGDILAHEPIYKYGLQNDESFGFLFEKMQDIISDSDVAVINQETPLTDDPAMVSDYPRFGTPVNVGQAIVDAGFDAVTCATNHALDRGAEGVTFTKRFFDENQVTCLGIQTADEKEDKPYAVIRRNGVSFALLNYTYGTNGIRVPEENPNMVHLFSDEGKMQKDIAQAKSEADFVIVFAHWGTEYSKEPDEFQRKWTQVFLESGVDVVVGTHPHVLQPYEMLTDDSGHQMLVYYSLGNYISAQPEMSCTKGGMAEFSVSLTPEGYEITEYDLQPLTITWQQGGRYTVGL